MVVTRIVRQWQATASDPRVYAALPASAQPRLSAVYLGVDPGAGGGVAVHCGTVTRAERMPATERDVWDLIRGAGGTVLDRRPRLAVVELVGGYVKGGEDRAAGGGAANGSAMFKFGYSVGLLRMALTAAGISWEAVSPPAWQRGLGIPARRKGETRTAWKNRLKAVAQQLHPGLTVTLATADALLLLAYCRRKHEGTLGR